MMRMTYMGSKEWTRGSKHLVSMPVSAAKQNTTGLGHFHDHSSVLTAVSPRPQ